MREEGSFAGRPDARRFAHNLPVQVDADVFRDGTVRVQIGEDLAPGGVHGLRRVVRVLPEVKSVAPQRVDEEARQVRGPSQKTPGVSGRSRRDVVQTARSRSRASFGHPRMSVSLSADRTHMFPDTFFYLSQYVHSEPFERRHRMRMTPTPRACAGELRF